MKLYTEEQVTELTTAAYYAGQNHNTFIFGNKFENITPIELPSDEEVEKWAFEKYHEVEDSRWFEPLQIGAKWMRDKLTSGNNERK
jgi:hypothetical protein